MSPYQLGTSLITHGPHNAGTTFPGRLALPSTYCAAFQKNSINGSEGIRIEDFDQNAPHLRNTHLFLSAFPVFVPSLSWF